MAAFGQQLSNVQHYYYEQWINIALGWVVPQGSSASNSNLLSYYMPWQGDILIDGWANCYYDSGASVLSMACWPASNIGATTLWAGNRTETDGNGGWLSIPCFARWANLAAGTYFTFGLQFNCGAVNGRATYS